MNVSLESGGRKIKNSDEAKTYADAIARLEKSLQRAKDAYIAGVDTLEEYGENKTRIQNEIEKNKKLLNEQHTQKPTDPKELAENIKRAIEFIQDENNSLDDKNKALKQFISKITFIKASKTLEITYF